MTTTKGPSLVERLTNPIAQNFETTVQMITRWRAEREEAASYITELEGENEKLRLAICGGEDAPGYAASLPLEAILKVCADNHATARRDAHMAWDGDTATSWRARAEAAEANSARLEEALRPFAQIVPSSLFPADGSEGEVYELFLTDDPCAPISGADLAKARAALEQTKGESA